MQFSDLWLSLDGSERRKAGKREILEAKRIADFCRSELRWADEGTTQQTFLMSNVVAITRASLHCLVCQLHFAESANRLFFLLSGFSWIIMSSQTSFFCQRNMKRNILKCVKNMIICCQMCTFCCSFASFFLRPELKIHYASCEIKIPWSPIFVINYTQFSEKNPNQLLK